MSITALPGTPKRKRQRDQSVRLTETDLTLLFLLCRLGATTVPTLLGTIYQGSTRSGVYARLARLVKIGLVEDPRTGPSNECRPRNLHALYVPTAKAYKVCGVSLDYKQPPLATLLHTLAVAEVALGYVTEGYSIVTDREIKSQVATWKSAARKAAMAAEVKGYTAKRATVPEDAHWIVTDQGTGSSTPGFLTGARGMRTHAPDLIAIDADGKRIAVEVELSAKSDRDLRAVMSAFDDGGRDKYTNVVYWIADKSIAQSVAAAAASVGLVGPFLTVRRYVPGHSPKP